MGRAVTSVKLHARPRSLRGIDVSRLTDAMSLDDQPFGFVELDGVSYVVAVVRARSGALRLNVSRQPPSGGVPIGELLGTAVKTA